MSDEFKINIIYNNEKPSFQNVMNKLYIDFLKTNLESVANKFKESYNDINKNILAKNEEVEC